MSINMDESSSKTYRELHNSIKVLTKKFNEINYAVERLDRRSELLMLNLRTDRLEALWCSLEKLSETENKMRNKVYELEQRIDYIEHKTLMQHFTDEVLAEPRRSNKTLQTIVEEEEPIQGIPIPQIQVEPQNISEINISAVREEITMGRTTDHIEIPMELERDLVEKDSNVLSESHRVQTNVEPMDISELLTQKLETLSQQKKRVSEYDKSPKRQKLVGYMSFRESQSQREVEISNIAVDKENIPPGNEQTERPSQNIPNITSMLQQAGLTEIQASVIVEPQEKDSQVRGRRGESESSETPLGSLDRTKVSLGDSVRTTDSQKFIRNQWGIEGTMVKIMAHVKAGTNPLSVDALITKGPIMPGYKKIIAARCFTSILKLKQHEFIKIVKDLDTLEIKNIVLGPKFPGLE